MKTTVDILALLASFYKQVYITKPQTSRYANSEKYVVCKDFLFDSAETFLPKLRAVFADVLSGANSTQFELFQINPSIFVNKLEEYNAIFGQQQIENIHYTIQLIENKHKNSKIDGLVKQNIQKCLQWCTKYNMPHHKMAANDLATNSFMPHSNIFLRESQFTMAAES